MKDEPTIQRILKGYKDAGDTASAARLLRHLSKRDRGTERHYPDPRTKKEPHSGDWQLTRSHAAAALRDGILEPHSLLEIHLRDAFTARPGESIEDRRKRAVEVFDACLNAAESLNKPEERGTFVLADAAIAIAIRAIKSGRFPTKAEVKKAAVKITGRVNPSTTEWTKILGLAHLSFLETGDKERRA